MTTATAFPTSRVAQGSAFKIMPGQNDVKDARKRPAQIAILARGNAAATYASTKRRIYSKYDVSKVEGFGSPAHLIAEQLFDYGIGDIPVTLYPLDLTGTAAAGTVTPSGTATKPQSYAVKMNNILSDRFMVAAGASVEAIIASMVAAVNAVARMPVIASNGTTVGDFVGKWHGTTGNNLHIEIVEYQDDSEISFAIVQPTGGAGVPDITAALAQIGKVWETHIITDLDYTDSDELDELQTFGQGSDGFGGRRSSETHKPLVVFTGTNESAHATVTAVTDARKDDMTNVIVPGSAGGNDLPFVIAANWCREVAKMDNSDPTMDYINLPLSGLTAGPDGSQWEATDGVMDAVVKMGCSTVQLIDGVVCISDTVTCYHPTGEEPPMWRYVCDIAKDSNITNELDLTISPLKARPLIPDTQTSDNPNAIKPKMVKGKLRGASERLGKGAFISDPDWSIENSTVSIGTTNPKRLDIVYRAMRSGNANVLATDIRLSFYFGG